MAIKQLSDDEALALSGSTDAATGMEYPRLLQARWGEGMLRALRRFVDVAAPDLRVLEVEDNADAVAVLAGSATIAGTLYSYAGATGDNGAVDDLADNDTTYLYAEVDGGALTIGSAVDGDGWPATAHLKLAAVTLADGAITEIVDLRGAQMLATALAGEQLAAATTATRGGVSQAAAVADLDQAISDPPTQTEVQAISDKVDALLAALRTAGMLAE